MNLEHLEDLKRTLYFLIADADSLRRELQLGDFDAAEITCDRLILSYARVLDAAVVFFAGFES